MLLAISFVMGSALAEPVVLHDSADTDSVQSDVIKHSELQLGEFRMTHFDDFLKAQQVSWKGPGGLQACADEPVTEENLAIQVSAAESRLLYQEMEQASSFLTESQALLACLTTVATPAMGARIGLLRGVLAEETRDPSAFDHFSFAARFDSDVAWDPQFTLGKRLFDAAKLELKSGDPVVLNVVPRPAEGQTLHLNGTLADASSGSVSVPVGANLLQIQSEGEVVGFTVTVNESSSPSMLVPQSLSASTLASVETVEGQQELSRVIAMTFDSGTPVYIASDDRLWQTASGFPAWVNLKSDVAPSDDFIGRSPEPVRVRPAAWISATLTAAVAAGTGFAFMVGEASWNAVEEQDRSFASAARSGNFDRASQVYTDAMQSRSRSTLGYAVAGVGAAATVAGIVVTVPMFKVGR